MALEEGGADRREEEGHEAAEEAWLSYLEGSSLSLPEWTELNAEAEDFTPREW